MRQKDEILFFDLVSKFQKDNLNSTSSRSDKEIDHLFYHGGIINTQKDNFFI